MSTSGVYYDRHWPWEKIAATNPKYWWNLYRECILDEIKVLDKKTKTKRNIDQKKMFEEMLADTNKMLAGLDKA